ncbi:MAG: dihydroneopterin aldolase [Pseudomonadota bacterium]
MRTARHATSDAPDAANAPEADATYRILVRDLVLPWRIGVRQHEEDRRQRVRINLDLIVREQPEPSADNYHEVICYERIIERIRQMAAAGHVKLAETVAHNVAMMCLSEPDAFEVTVRVEKLEAIHDAGSVGVEITRFRHDSGEKRTPSPLRMTEKP